MHACGVAIDSFAKPRADARTHTALLVTHAQLLLLCQRLPKSCGQAAREVRLPSDVLRTILTCFDATAHHTPRGMRPSRVCAMWSGTLHGLSLAAVCILSLPPSHCADRRCGVGSTWAPPLAPPPRLAPRMRVAAAWSTHAVSNHCHILWQQHGRAASTVRMRPLPASHLVGRHHGGTSGISGASGVHVPITSHHTSIPRWVKPIASVVVSTACSYGLAVHCVLAPLAVTSPWEPGLWRRCM